MQQPQPSQPTFQLDSNPETPPAYHPASDDGPKPDNQATRPPLQRTSPSAATGEGDLVDRIFDYLLSDPAMARAVQAMAKATQQPLRQLKAAVRAEFSGERCYITANPATERQQRAAEVLRLFNGRNASEIARRLQIGRTTVYRYIRQARAEK
ncbi:MAG: Mor transcription activator family protein [Burkholderiaceae bacterium]